MRPFVPSFASMASRLSLLCGCSLFFVATSTAHAATLTTCQAGDSAFLCHLRSFLTLLDTAAWGLGSLLVIAIVLAVRAYRRKGRKLSPEDITSDAP